MSALAWWLHIGCATRERVLVYGQLDPASLGCLAGIAQRIDLLACARHDAPADDGVVDIARDDLFTREYDAIVVNRRDLQPGIDDGEVIALVERCLAPDGVLCLYQCRASWRSLLTRPRALLRYLPRRRAGFAFAAAGGFPRLCRYRAISYGRVPHESFPPGHYHNNKNIFLFKEKVRRLLLRSLLAGFFANGDIWVVRKSGRARSLVVELFAEMERLGVPWRGRDRRVIKTMYRGGKILFSVTSSARDEPEFIAVVALDDGARRQRDDEQRAIGWLAGRAELAGLVPAYRATSRLGPFGLYVMTEFDGITVDIENRALPSMTANVFATICRYTGQTIEAGSAGALRALAGDYVDTLANGFPEFHDRWVRIGDCLAGVDLDRFPAVFMHGDAKLENFVLDERHEVIGIIDFELAAIRGFALLDLYYLIAYNHLMEHGRRFDLVFRKLVDDDLRDHERDMIEAYCRRFGIARDQREVLKLVFFLHHYARRYRVRAGPGDSWKAFEKALNIADDLAARIRNNRGR